MEHLSLNYITGLDPEGIRVRNAQGLDAVDSFFPGADSSPSQHHASAGHREPDDLLIAGTLCFTIVISLDPECFSARNDYISRPGLKHRFGAGYDVWAQAITSLADIGYDPNSMVALPYDWRLSISNLEQRDAYYSRLRAQARPLPCSHLKRIIPSSH